MDQLTNAQHLLASFAMANFVKLYQDADLFFQKQKQKEDKFPIVMIRGNVDKINASVSDLSAAIEICMSTDSFLRKGGFPGYKELVKFTNESKCIHIAFTIDRPILKPYEYIISLTDKMIADLQ